MQQTKKVELIKVSNPFVDEYEKNNIKKKRVAAYARVSTDEDDQLNSYNNQIEEFEKKIKENPKWEFAGMYADEGITGTSLKKRKQFVAMLEAARAGKIDLILVKSISRFGRNTVDVLSVVQEFRLKNIEIYFEKENLSSLNPQIDMVLTMLISVAQEESRSISSNIKWTIKKKFKEGKVIVNTAHFLGYTKDKQGNLVIVPDEAKIIKEIYNLYIAGFTISDIKEVMNERGIKTPAGKDSWRFGTIKNILTNEKYCGDAILQKTIVVDYLTHKSVKNDNIAPKYFVTNNHEGIVSKEVFEEVQFLLKSDNREKQSDRYYKFPLTHMVYCSECGRPMKRRHVHPEKPKYHYVALDCNQGQGKTTCKRKCVKSDIIDEVCSAMASSMLDNNKLFTFLMDVLNQNKDYSSDTQVSRHLHEQLIIEKQKEEELSKIKPLTKSKIDEISALFNEQHSKIAKLEEDIKDVEQVIAAKVKSKSRIHQIEEYCKNPDMKNAKARLYRALFQLIFVNKNGDVTFVIPNSPVSNEELIANRKVIIAFKPILKKTYYSKSLNMNIDYKVVLYDKK